MATFFIKHITKYDYSNKVFDGANLIRLHPIEDEYQKVVSHFLSVTNNPFIETFTDFYNNRIGTFMVTEQHNELLIESEIEIITYQKLFPDDSTDIKTQWSNLKSLKHNISYIDFLKYETFNGSTDIENLLNTKSISTKSPYTCVLELCEYIYSNFKYIQGITQVDSTLNDVWSLKAGVCQDFTNILLQMLRMADIPARYVSGYICPSDAITRGEGATHAWVEAYIPFYGWLGIDPTNNIIANENHVRLAIGRNYNDCAPVKGVFKGSINANLTVKVIIGTTKNDDYVIPETTEEKTENNSYLKNLKLRQQIQQQQQ